MKMLRTSLLLGIVLLLTGILPVLAHGGSCARMPCCHPKGRVITQSGASCCSPATCARETAGIKDGEIAKRHEKQVAALPAVVAGQSTMPSQAAAEKAPLPSETPPRTSNRLAVLCILLI